MPLVSRTAPFATSSDKHVGSHVMLAEDDAEMRRILVRVLTKDGYRVTAVEGGRELVSAFEELRERDLLPDLVVTDIRMPGASGFDFLERADAPRAVPVILITAFCDEVALQRAAALGASCVLSKPFDMDVLRSAVMCVLAGSTEPVAE